MTAFKFDMSSQPTICLSFTILTWQTGKRMKLYSWAYFAQIFLRYTIFWRRFKIFDLVERFCQLRVMEVKISIH